MAIAEEILRNQDKDGMLRRALERIIQLYTDKSHFVYELLQNAEDAGASQILFRQYPDRLEVMHNGHPFTTQNLEGLCDIGKSDKIGDLNQIGEFGVGFKSVFGICDKVYLYSHPSPEELTDDCRRFSVEIRDFTHPVDIDDWVIERGYTTLFVFPYAVGFPFSGFSSMDLLNQAVSDRLKNLGTTTLLFMKNLQFIQYEIKLPTLKTRGSYLLDKKQINDHCCLVSSYGETGRKREQNLSYLVFSRDVRGAQIGRTIDIAFTVIRDQEGQYQFLPSKSPYVSVYFPTETESKLNFIVQGPFRTTPNRSSVPFDDKDNRMMATQMAELLRDSILELRDLGQVDYSLLNILPVNKSVFENSPLFAGMWDVTLNILKKETIYRCKNGKYAPASRVKIARGDKFSEILNEELLTELINDGKTYYWLPTFLTETNRQYKDLYTFLTSDIGIAVLRPEILKDYYNSNIQFLKRRDKEWLISFYKMYATVGRVFSRDDNGSMLTAKIIKTTSGDFVAPYRKVDKNAEAAEGTIQRYYLYGNYDENASYVPNVFLPPKSPLEVYDINIVDPELYAECRNFFADTLGLTVPNKYAFFVHDFQKRGESDFPASDEQHVQDLENLFLFWDDREYGEEIRSLARKYLRVRCDELDGIQYISPYQDKIYFEFTESGRSIQQYLFHIPIKNVHFIDLSFYEEHKITRQQLSRFDIIGDLTQGESVTNGEYVTFNPGKNPTWSTIGVFRWKLTLPFLSDVLDYIEENPGEPDSMAKSSFIWNFLKENEQKLQGTVHISGITADIENTTSEIISTLKRDESERKYYGTRWNGKWLYTEAGDLVAPKEVSKSELNTSLYGKAENSGLYNLLGFRLDKEEQLQETERQLQGFTEEQRDQMFELELRRRYGFSVSQLEQRIEYLHESSQDVFNFADLKVDSFAFPSSRVKNWDSLRKHSAEMLCYANPVKYNKIVRSIRVSKSAEDVRSYMKSMYRIDGEFRYVCQWCHKAFSDIEICQIQDKPELELEPMNLCLCPNCAAKYRKRRSQPGEVDTLLKSITSLSDSEISSNEPVVVKFGNRELWFTQTHIAEIRELISLKKKADQQASRQAAEQKKVQKTTAPQGKKEKTPAATPTKKSFYVYVRENIKCPKCNSLVRLTQTSNGQYLITCSRYPACKHATVLTPDIVYAYINQKHEKKICPECKHELVVYKNNNGEFLYIRCKGELHHKIDLSRI